MRETHLFYDPELSAHDGTLPAEEAAHAVRVLRMKEGDELTLTDGRGHFALASITAATPKRCLYRTTQQWDDPKLWNGNIRLAVAPTKNMDRMEWFCEKATEIGVDSIHLLLCDNSERRVVKTERLEKIVTGAMKQSHKAQKPEVEELVKFMDFVKRDFPADCQRFIAHCHTPQETDEGAANEQTLHLTNRNFLGDLLQADGDAVVLIGPEGDFTPEEVAAAEAAGFQPISLGESRLRTETAALVAVHLMYLAKRLRTKQ